MPTPEHETLVVAINGFADRNVLDPVRRRQVARIMLKTVEEICLIARNGIRGNTTVKVCHPEGDIKRAYLNDREM